MTAPLDGVRVLDLGGEMAAYGTKLLADLGADVVKVEPGGGDRQRLRPPFAPGASGIEASLHFAYYNANKRGVEVDLDDEGAADVLRTLADGCDVVVLAPTAQRPVPGWDRETRTLSWAGPDTVVVVLTPYGTDGPYKHLRATHLTSFAHSGQMWTLGPPEGPPRCIPAQPMYDELSAHAATSVMVALRERPYVGGQVVELALHDMLAYRDTSAVAMWGAVRKTLQTRKIPPIGPPSGVWEVADGRVEFLTYNPSHWHGFVQMVGSPEDLQDPALAQRSTRMERAEMLTPRVAELLAPLTMEEVWDLAQEHKVPCAPVYTPLQVTQNAQLASRDYWRTHDRPGTGTFRAPGRPFKTETPLLDYRREAPQLGEHDDELLGGGWARSAAPTPPLLTTAGPRVTDLKVLTFGTAIAGNVTATTLAELGADVVKIESPNRPDPLRAGPISPFLPQVFEPSGYETNIMFSSYSRSCRSLALDMKDPADQETFRRLVREADVVVDNFATGVMASWGLSPDVLAAINPRLVMASVCGYGRTGPRGRTMAYGSNINAFMGLTLTWSPHGTQFDYTAVAHALVGIFGALAHRDRTGEGTFLDIAQVEAGGAMTAPLYLEALATGEDVRPTPNHVPGSVLSTVLPSAGTDAWVAVELETLADWNSAAELVGSPHLVVDGTWPTDQAVEHLTQALGVWAQGRTNEQAARELQDAGLAAAPVHEAADLWADASVWARGRVSRVTHPDLGPIDMVEPFQRLQSPRPAVRWAAARVGQHQDDVLLEWLGQS